MKKTIVKAFSLLVLASMFVGCATKDAYDIRPETAADGVPTGVEWQNAHNAELEAATRPEALMAFLASDEAADALLAKIGPAYKGDVIVLTQIAAISQLVMNRRHPEAQAGRSRWIAALKRAKATAKDDYVKTFCEQQLWWCE